MHSTTSRPEPVDRLADPSPAAAARRSLSPSDVALIVAVVAPLAIMGLLVMMGVGIGVAVCIAFVVVVAATTTLDVAWALRRRRLGNELRRLQR